ncbi:hypothetical protein [Thiolapillus sp.]
MNKIAGKTLAAALIGGGIALTSASGFAHGGHGHKQRVIIVKPAPPATVVVVKPQRRCRGYWHRGYWRCHRHPGRVLTHAVADAIWWESIHQHGKHR